jgi:site-specific recombinase XerD
MPRQPRERPLVIRRYGDIDLARGMRVKGGVYGDIEVIARYKHKRQSKCFRRDASLIERLAWQHQMVEQLRLSGVAPKPRKATALPTTTLRQDVDVYLASLTEERCERASSWLSYWTDWYGHQRRDELTLQQCQAFFQFVTPRSAPTKQFGASAKNKLRTYLIAVWKYHDGRRHECPASDVPLFTEPFQESRELEPSAILQILEAMSDTPNRARLGLLFTTGMRPVELTLLRPEMFHLDEAVPYVSVVPAKDGKARMVALPAMGVRYARDFLRHRAWTGSIRGLFTEMQRAAKACGMQVYTGGVHNSGRRKTRISPYALRHAYAMNLRRAGAGIEDIADALGHKSLETTRKYAQAIPERQVAVMTKMWEGVG